MNQAYGAMHCIDIGQSPFRPLYMGFHYPLCVRKAVAIDPPAFGPPRRLLLTWPGMAAVASACFGRWTVKLNLKAMYHDDSLVADATIDEYARPPR